VVDDHRRSPQAGSEEWWTGGASIVTVAISVTIRLHLRSNVSDAQINTGVGHFGPKFPGVPLGIDP